MRTTLLSLCGILIITGISGCGNSQGDRAISGAGIGAGAGAVAGAITGGSATTGALLGAGLGAATGAVTKEKDLNLGKPAWR